MFTWRFWAATEMFLDCSTTHTHDIIPFLILYSKTSFVFLHSHFCIFNYQNWRLRIRTTTKKKYMRKRTEKCVLQSVPSSMHVLISFSCFILVLWADVVVLSKSHQNVVNNVFFRLRKITIGIAQATSERESMANEQNHQRDGHLAADENV